MKLIDNNGNEVAPTLKAIYDAVENTGAVKTNYAHLILRHNGDSYIVTDYYNAESPKCKEPDVYNTFDEAYVKFCSFIKEYFQVILP